MAALGALLIGEAALLTSCALARPARAVVGPAPADLSADAVRFRSGSGSDVRAWFSAGTPGRGAVLLLHGVGANRTVMLGRARFLRARGHSVLLPDFQAHGESPGRRITYGALESADAEAALAYLRRRAPGERVGVIGVSMGGAATLLARGPLQADAVVLESVYPTIDDAVRDRLRVWLGPLGSLSRAVTPGVIRVVGARIGVPAHALRPIERVGLLSAPVLVAAGTRDRYTPLAESRALYAAARTPKEFWPVRGAGHEDLHAFAPAEYERRIGGFLERHLHGPAALAGRVAAPASGAGRGGPVRLSAAAETGPARWAPAAVTPH